MMSACSHSLSLTVPYIKLHLRSVCAKCAIQGKQTATFYDTVGLPAALYPNTKAVPITTLEELHLVVKQHLRICLDINFTNMAALPWQHCRGKRRAGTAACTKGWQILCLRQKSFQAADAVSGFCTMHMLSLLSCRYVTNKANILMTYTIFELNSKYLGQKGTLRVR